MSGGAAFPSAGGSASGMDLRDYFAAKALAALLIRVDTVSGDWVTNGTPLQAAESAYEYADAMLKARQS